MNFRFNYFNVIFYGIIGYFIGGQIYESVFLPYISESVGINQIWRYSSEKIHEIVVYNNRNAYLWLEPNSKRFSMYFVSECMTQCIYGNFNK